MFFFFYVLGRLMISSDLGEVALCRRCPMGPNKHILLWSWKLYSVWILLCRLCGPSVVAGLTTVDALVVGVGNWHCGRQDWVQGQLTARHEVSWCHVMVSWAHDTRAGVRLLVCGLAPRTNSLEGGLQNGACQCPSGRINSPKWLLLMSLSPWEAPFASCMSRRLFKISK